MAVARAILSTKRKWLLKKQPAEPMRAWLSTALPKWACDFSDLSILVVDLETSGLDANTAEILSVGWVELRGARALLGSLHHELVSAKNGVNDSAVIHQIVDHQLENAASEREVLCQLIEASKGKIMVFHCAALDMAFLNKASMTHFSVPFAALVIDTMALEQRRLQRSKGYIEQGALRLHSCRAQYGLPLWKAHNAATDALACAELLLAQVSDMGGAKNVSLGQLV